MKHHKLLWILAGLLLFVSSPPFLHPEPQDLKSKEKELQKLRREIDDYEKKIKKSERRENATLETIGYYDQQILLIRKLLRRLKEESNGLQRDIEAIRRNIGTSEDQLQSLRSHYAEYVTSAYKYGRLHDLELLLTSSSVNQFAIRAEYLRRFSAQRSKDLRTIAEHKSNLEGESTTLRTKLNQQQQLITEKATEEKTIKRKAREKQKLLASIRRDKDNYKKQLQRRKNDAADLEAIIADLIEKERIKKAHEEALAKREKRAPPEATSAGLAFLNRRGRLPWPVSGGSIVSRFGNQIHPVLKTVTQNTGIDISVPTGTEVRAVASGDVATISWLPSYGNLLILNHNNGFRSVYTHLSEITVTQGQKVNEGQAIGRSGESLAGPLLHFELWKEREKQDPELWLTKR
ncbi:MAG: peptidoglycan DD-metalloendopeptidase family protein [Bacteroidota bacterium]